MKIALLVVLATAALTSCATTAPFENSDGTVMLSKMSHALASTGGIKADLLFEAAEYCEKRGQKVEPVSADGSSGIPFLRPGTASITFRCVAK